MEAHQQRNFEDNPSVQETKQSQIAPLDLTHQSSSAPSPLTSPIAHLHRKRKKYGLFVFVLCAAQYLLVYFHRNSTAVLASDLAASWDADISNLAVFSSLYFYTYAFTQPLAGIAVDRFGARKLMSAASLVSALSAFIIASSNNITVALVGRALSGLGSSFVYVPSLKLASLWFQESFFAKASGILMSVGGVGALVATAPLRALADSFSWRVPILCAGILSLVVGALFWVFARDSPSDLGLPAPTSGDMGGDTEKGEGSVSDAAYCVEDTTTTAATAAAVPARKESPAPAPATPGIPSGLKPAADLRPHPSRSLRVHVVEVLGSGPQFWLQFATQFLMTGCNFTIAAILGAEILMDLGEISPKSASLALSLMPCGQVIGGPLVTSASDKWGRKPTCVACSGVLVFFGLGMYFFVSASLVVPMVLYMLLGLVAGPSTSVAYASIKETFPPRLTGSAIGFFNLGPFLGAALLQNVGGMLVEGGGLCIDQNECTYKPVGYQRTLIMMTCAGVVSIVLLMFWKETLFSKRKSSKYNKKQ